MSKRILVLILMFVILNSGLTASVKFNPGHYVTLQNKFTQADLLDVLKTPGLEGVQLRYTWKSMETSEGVYDFSKIQSDLEIVSNAEKYMIVFFEDKSFVGGVRYTPEYLWEEYTVPSGLSMNGEEGFISKRWDDFVVRKISDLMDAMAREFDDEPWFEGVAFQESAIGVNDTNLVKYEYTPEKYRDALIQLLINMKSSFKSSQVFWYMNYLAKKQEYIRNIANAIVPYKVIMGGPDILPDNSSLSRMTYPFYEEFNDKLTLFCSIQNDSYHHLHATEGYNTKFWTLEELLLWGRDNLHINYCFWNYSKWNFEEGAYNWYDAKPVILKYSNLATSLKPKPEENKYKVYPNPGNGLFTVLSPAPGAGYEISVYDLTGKKVCKKECSGETETIDIRQMEAGMYLFKMDDTCIHVIKN
jgi:hypothetical protein